MWRWGNHGGAIPIAILRIIIPVVNIRHICYTGIFRVRHGGSLPGLWQICNTSWETAWATEKSVKFLDESCILPNLWYSSQVLVFWIPCTTRLAGLEIQENFVKTCASRRGCHARNLQSFSVEVCPLHCCVLRNSLVVRREILMRPMAYPRLFDGVSLACRSCQNTKPIL